MGWDEAKKNVQQGEYMRWDDAPFEIWIKSEPEVRKKHFVKGGGYLGPCDGDDCEHCAAGIAPTTDYSFAVQDSEGEKRLGFSQRAFVQLLEFRGTIGEDRFSKCIVRCDRKGIGKNTRYIYEDIGDAPTDGVPF